MAISGLNRITKLRDEVRSIRAEKVGSEDLASARARTKEDPVWGVRNVLGQDPWPVQEQIIRSVWDNPRTAVAACHAIGKSFITASIILTFLWAHEDSKVIISAPTWRQVQEVVWKEVRSLWEKAPKRFCAKPLISPKLELGPAWFALGFSSNDPDKFQGFHAPYILVVLDEASGIPSPVFGALRSLMASGHVRLLLLGNPTKVTGDFYAAFHQSRHMYQTFQVSAWDTPNLAPLRDQCFRVEKAERLKILRSAPCPRPYLITPSFVADAEEEFGIDSDFYRVRVLGQFPRESPDQLVSLDLVEQAIKRWEDLHHGANPQKPWWEQLTNIGPCEIRAGLDVARKGSNESVWGARLDEVGTPQVCWVGTDTVDLAGHVMEQIRKHRVTTQVVDADGLGGGPCDQLKRLFADGQVLEWQGGRRTEQSRVASLKEVKRFANNRAEGFWGLRMRFLEGRIAIPRDEKLIGQLTSIRYGYRANGELLIESKDDMEKRGLSSPDRADELMMRYADFGPFASKAYAVAQPESVLTEWSF